MPTPNGVNDLLQFLQYCPLIPQLSNNKNQKWTFQSFVFILSLLCHHTLIYYTVRLQFLFDGANIRIFPETCKHFGDLFVIRLLKSIDCRLYTFPISNIHIRETIKIGLLILLLYVNY